MEIASILMTVAASLTALGVVLLAIKKIAAFVRRAVHVVDEIIGVPDRDGLPGHPGLSARLMAIEYELKPNGGHSLKDQIGRLEEWTVAHSLVHRELNQKQRYN